MSFVAILSVDDRGGIVFSVFVVFQETVRCDSYSIFFGVVQDNPQLGHNVTIKEGQCVKNTKDGLSLGKYLVHHAKNQNDLLIQKIVYNKTNKSRFYLLNWTCLTLHRNL